MATAPQSGVDYRGSGTIDPAHIAQAGYQFVVQYIGVTDDSGYLRPNDVTSFENQHLSIVSVFEKAGMSDTDASGHYTNQWVNYFVPGQGAEDAARAIEAAQKAGQPTGSAIYFAIDLDPGAARS